MTLTFEQLREANVARQRGVWRDEVDWGPTDWATAMAGECGEACNVVKKMRRVQSEVRAGFGRPEDVAADLRPALAAELADLICYADLLANRCGIDLGEAIRRKFNRVSERVGSPVKL